jgi:hypothetical protein
MNAGEKPVSTWIKTGRKNHFGGAFGRLESWQKGKPSQLSYAIQLIQCYTYFVSKSVTKKQMCKFLDGVLANPPSDSSLEKGKTFVRLGMKIAKLQPIKQMPKIRPILDYDASASRRAPTPYGSVPEEEGVIDSLSFLWESAGGYSHLMRFLPFYNDVVKGLEWYRYSYLSPGPVQVKEKEFVVGNIGLIQEPGYKLRAVANPGRIFQRVLEPLGKVLYNVLNQLSWDCTFDQTRAVEPLHQALRNGTVVHSVDLSGATDYFPLALQEEILRSFVPSDWVDLFAEISRGQWRLPNVGNIQWKRGQPLGLFPSFAAFALTHGTLLLGLLGRPWNGEFFILGDDVVILDSELAHSYLNLMEELECPISLSKSLVSNKLCEFAGKVITSDEVIPQFKYREVSDDSFIDLARNLGPKSISLFRCRQKKVLKRIAPLPESLGGFGWNSEGIPLKDRLSNASWINDPPKPKERTMSLAETNIRLQMKSRCLQTLLSREGSDASLRHFPIQTTGTLDQRAQALTSDLMPGWLSWYKLLGKNLDQILNDLGQVTDLPIKGAVSRISTLEVWERKLG